MQKWAPCFFIAILLAVSLSGCIGADESNPSDEQKTGTLLCSEMQYITHEVTISLIDYEFSTWEEQYPSTGLLSVDNSDLEYFDNATQVLFNGQIYDLHAQAEPTGQNHSQFRVMTNNDNEDPNIVVNKGDTVCLIENPNVEHDIHIENRRQCHSETTRLENGSYEHEASMCNHTLTEHLDRTSTIYGGIEFRKNGKNPNVACENLDDTINVNTNHFIGVNYTVAGSWGHFAEGNEFRIYYNGPDEEYVTSYFVKEQKKEYNHGMIYSKGILQTGCGVAVIELFADKNLTTPATLDRNLTSDDSWEVIADGCTFYRYNYLLGTSIMPIIHSCEGTFLGLDKDWWASNYPEFDVDAYEEESRNSGEDIREFFDNFSQAMISKNYSMWHDMLSEEVHAINSDTTYQKSNLNESFFQNFTSTLGSINLENASRLDLAQSHLQLTQLTFSNAYSTFDWEFETSLPDTNITSPLKDSVLVQDRIYNSTGYGYDDTFIDTPHLMIMTWVVGPNTPSLLSEYLLTIVVDRDDDGQLSIVGIPDYTVMVTN